MNIKARLTLDLIAHFLKTGVAILISYRIFVVDGKGIRYNEHCVDCRDTC